MGDSVTLAADVATLLHAQRGNSARWENSAAITQRLWRFATSAEPSNVLVALDGDQLVGSVKFYQHEISSRDEKDRWLGDKWPHKFGQFSLSG